jgi:hypothetical protein
MSESVTIRPVAKVNATALGRIYRGGGLTSGSCVIWPGHRDGRKASIDDARAAYIYPTDPQLDVTLFARYSDALHTLPPQPRPFVQ